MKLAQRFLRRNLSDKERVIEDLVDLFDHYEVDGRRVV